MEWVVDGRFHTTSTTVDAVGVSANSSSINGTTVAFFAPNRTPHAHPQACLSYVADVSAISARAGTLVFVPSVVPFVRRFATSPSRIIAVDRIAWFWVDQVAVGFNRDGD